MTHWDWFIWKSLDADAIPIRGLQSWDLRMVLDISHELLWHHASESYQDCHLASKPGWLIPANSSEKSLREKIKMRQRNQKYHSFFSPDYDKFDQNNPHGSYKYLCSLIYFVFIMPFISCRGNVACVLYRCRVFKWIKYLSFKLLMAGLTLTDLLLKKGDNIELFVMKTLTWRGRGLPLWLWLRI